MSELREIERDALTLARRVRLLGRKPTPEEDRVIKRESAQIRDRLSRAMVGELITNRPEVISHGRPVAGDAARRGLEEARRRLQERRGFKTACSACPAAQVAHGNGVVAVTCGVEGTRLTSREDPQSLLTFCFGDYTACPSWIAECEARQAGKKGALAAA